VLQLVLLGIAFARLHYFLSAARRIEECSVGESRALKPEFKSGGAPPHSKALRAKLSAAL
jgi:hypothetical protein